MSCPYRDNFDTIVGYVREELPPDQQESFEAHFLDCDECAREVLWVEKTTLAMKHYGQDLFAPAYKTPANVLIRYKNFLVDGFEKLSWSLGKWRPAIGYAALILIASGGFWLFHKMNEALRGTNHDFYESLWGADDPALKLPRFEWPADFASIDDANLQQRLEALRPVYQNKAFSLVSEALAFLANQYPYEPQLQLLWGLSLFQEQKFEDAMQRLAPLATDEKAPAEALWYLAWAYRQQRQIEPARQTLQKLLARSDHPYHQPAQKLWNSLQ